MVHETKIAINIKAGALNAFQEFYQTNYKRLLNYATLFISQSDEAEDIVQECFYSLWHNRKDIDENQSISGFLFRSIRNQCLNKIKHNQVRDKFVEFAKNYENIEHVYLQDFSLEDDDHENFYVMSEITKAIESLPQKRKEVYKLSKIEGYSHNQIAQELDITTKGVERHITMANKALRTKLKHLKTAIFVLSVLP